MSFVLDRLDPNLDFHVAFLKIGQKLTELRELEDKNAVSYENQSDLLILAATCIHLFLRRRISSGHFVCFDYHK